MSQGYQVIVCGSVVPDPLQTLEPAETPAGPGLKNEMMLPAWLDPWAGHALYEAAALAASYGILLFLWLLDSLSGPEAAWHWLALLPHTQPWLQGLLRSQDIVFFLGTGIGAVWLASYTLARRRGEI